jgi:hypothetical protein
MKHLLRILFFAVIVINLFFTSWYVLHNDISFTSDIARDFFLLREIQQKKFVLIGPNSSTGLFHGPLWSYLNTPAFLIGKGNPVIVGWFWILLIAAFLICCFYIAKSLFDKNTAYLFTLMMSIYMIFHAHSMFNPHGAMLLLPAFFLILIKYFQKKKLSYLITLFIIVGAIIQFQLAIGIPFLILSIIAVSYQIIRFKLWMHISAFLVIPVSISNFIFFDLRHNHLLYNLLSHYIVSPARDRPDYFALIINRVSLAFSAVEFLRRDILSLNLFLFVLMLMLLLIQIKKNKYKLIYLSFLYFYFGFFILSLFNTGPILYFYFFPLFPLVFLIFSSLITNIFKKIFLLLFALIFILNIHTVFLDISDSKNIIGSDIYSWKFLSDSARIVYDGKEKTFGYFIYAPNTLAYEEKYAMLYTQNLYNKQAYYFKKKPITYIIAAPPPSDNPYMQDEWWIKNKVKFNKKPETTITLTNGYKIERFVLTNDEININPDPLIDPGLSFR